MTQQDPYQNLHSLSRKLEYSNIGPARQGRFGNMVQRQAKTEQNGAKMEQKRSKTEQKRSKTEQNGAKTAVWQRYGSGAK